MAYSALGGPGIKKPRNLKETGNDTFDSTAAPRVGGRAAKATSVYTGKGAAKGASKLKRSGAVNKAVRSKSKAKF